MCLHDQRQVSVELLSTCAAPGSARLEVGTGFRLIVHYLVLVDAMASSLLAADDTVDHLRELKTILSGGEAAESDVKETLNCAICMGSISDFFAASCMSCVCEGIFHKDCLERVESALGRRRCPYCRTEGRILSLHVPYNSRELVERRIWRVESQLLRQKLVENEGEIVKRTKLLSEGLCRLKKNPGGEDVYSKLLHPPAVPKRKRTPYKTFCSLCDEGIMSFSDLMTQCCQCCALYHPSCLKTIESGECPENILCCVECKSVDILPEGVAVKSLMAASLPEPSRSASKGIAPVEANEILEGQLRRLAQLELRLRRVEDCIERLACIAEPREESPARKRHRRLAYLPP